MGHTGQPMLKMGTAATIHLTNNKGIAICNTILLSHFLSRKNYDIINIANYGWKCGYRGGALSYFSLYNYHNRIYNVFYYNLNDDSYIFESFQNKEKG